MSKRTCALVLAGALLLGALLIPAAAQTQMMEQEQKAMEAYMRAMAVTDNHKALEFLVGDWQVKTTMWMMPGQPPSESSGSGRGELILGGRFVLLKYKGTMMGQPFEGLQINGFDNIGQKFVTFWIDSTSTSFFLLTGTRDAETGTFNDSGDWADALTGGTSKVRTTTKILGPDEFLYEMYMVADGGEFKSMENRYTRVK